jgi:hypothetical protein
VIVLDPASIPAGVREARDAVPARIEDAASTVVASLKTVAPSRHDDPATAYLQVEAGIASARRVHSKFGYGDGCADWHRRPAEGSTR